MNKQLVVTKLAEAVRFLRTRGSSDRQIQKSLIEQGWPFGAVKEALLLA